jgi:phosphopantothenoylcysteine decarboxylase/phosphopantothenate--cysteine ligase
MSVLSGRRVLVGVTGGIAAYKAVFLCRLLQKEGAEVRVAMTRSATRFVTPLTFEAITQHPVISEVFPKEEFVATRHISWAQWADLCVVAPATYNFVGKLTHGLADDALSTLLAALPESCATYLAVAMNSEMYAKIAFQENLKVLRLRGLTIIDADAGYLAERMEGVGRMAEPEHIVERIVDDMRARLPWTGTRVLVTAGPTRERLDPVRYLSNASSGKMGFAIAQEAAAAGADVTLIAGPVELETPRGVHRVNVTSAVEMDRATQLAWTEVDALFMVAAVADFVPVTQAPDKIKKADARLQLALKPAPDILRACGSTKRADQFLLGFAVETKNELEFARQKLETKNLDMIVVNNPTTPGAGFDVDTNVVTVVSGQGEERLPLMSKTEVAREVLKRAHSYISSTRTLRSTHG